MDTERQRRIDLAFHALREERDDLHALAAVLLDRFKDASGEVEDFIGSRLAGMLESKLGDLGALNEARATVAAQLAARAG